MGRVLAIGLPTIGALGTAMALRLGGILGRIGMAPLAKPYVASKHRG